MHTDMLVLDLALLSYVRVRWNEDLPSPFPFAIYYVMANLFLHVLRRSLPLGRYVSIG